MTVARSDLYAPADALRPLVHDLVTRLRRHAKVADAVSDAAAVLGLSRRTAQALYWPDTIAGRDLEPASIRARYARWLAAEACRLEQEAAELRARRAAIKEASDADALGVVAGARRPGLPAMAARAA